MHAVHKGFSVENHFGFYCVTYGGVVVTCGILTVNVSWELRVTVFYYLGRCPQGTKLWIIMEYLGGGSALDLVSVLWL